MAKKEKPVSVLGKEAEENLGPALMRRHNAQKTRKLAEDMVEDAKKMGLEMEIEGSPRHKEYR